MRDVIGQRPSTKSSGDDWLSPPNLVKRLGKFELDPACPPNMPWRTAKTMLTKKENGLLVPWRGRRTWLNPPYSEVLPWVELMAENNNGIMLVYARSTDTKWGQRALEACSAAYFLSGRILFFYPDGSPSEGKWCSNMLLAFGKENAKVLKDLSTDPKYPGVMMKRWR